MSPAEALPASLLLIVARRILRPVPELTIPAGYGMWTFEHQQVGVQHTALVTLGFKVATPPYTQAQCTSAGTAYLAAMTTLWDAEVTITRVIANIGNDGPPIRFESAINTACTRSAVAILPPNVTYLVRKTTAFGGRRYRGRMYLPFVSSTDTGTVQTGALTPAAFTLLQGRATALLTNLVAAGPNASELSLLHAEGKSTTPAPTPIQQLAADDFIATQRRRMVRQ
jgi:hypothetical protein